jgi:hypothetical protein
LLEATSSTAEGEHEEETSSKEDPFDKRLMLALFVALFLETVACLPISNLPSSQGRLSNFLFHFKGVIISIVDVIAVGHFFLLLAIFWQFLHADAKDKAFFGILFTAVVFIGLAIDALILMVATETRFDK